MGIASKGWTALCAALGLSVLSQAPEFSQQYKQRLGGGIEELGAVVEQFDTDAASQGLERAQAIETLKKSEEELPRLRGQSMETAINRYESLVGQQQAMQSSDPVLQPFHLMRYPDPDLLNGTWDTYSPAVPLDTAGALWGGLGALALGILGRLPISMRRWRRARQAPRVEHHPAEMVPPPQLANHDQHRDELQGADGQEVQAGLEDSPYRKDTKTGPISSPS